jgi:ribonuclease HI
VNRHDPGQLIVFADGGCINNGKPSARAGWGLAFGPSPQSVVSGPLEAAGPFGADFVPTSQRAELRAVIAAVRSPAWVRRYGFRRLLVVSGSQYAVEGATDRLRTWSTSDRLKKKANVDMWNALQGEVERQKEHEGLAIQMLFTPKSGKLWGFAAGAVWAAKRQSATSEVLPRWTDPVA